MALIKNNAEIGSLIAVELCKIRKLKEKKAVVSDAYTRCTDYCLIQSVDSAKVMLPALLKLHLVQG